MRTKERYEQALAWFEENMLVAESELHFENEYQLLVAVMLSAQCTDKRVNLVTPALFAAYPTITDLSRATAQEVLIYIRSVSYPNSKAEHLVQMAKRVVDAYDGQIPNTREELQTLAGVGRKTANLIVGDVYKKPAVVADTHLIRLTNRMGLVNTKDPKKVEMELKKILPPEESNDFCHRCVLHGRAVCTARKANCENCCLNEHCKKII